MMRSDSPAEIDMDELRQVLNAAEIVVFRFPLFGERLLADFRVNSEAGAFVRVVPPVNNFQERARYLRRMRPEFPAAEQVMVIRWPRSLEGFLTTGAMGAIVERLDRSDPASRSQVRDAFKELVELEREAEFAAVRGSGYQALWERSSARQPDEGGDARG